MATGGTGDVLTGVIAALLAQKLAPFEAAQLGVFIHGLAGDIARDQNGEIGLIAGDLVDALPDAFVHAMPDPDLGLRRHDSTVHLQETGYHWSMPRGDSGVECLM